MCRQIDLLFVGRKLVSETLVRHDFPAFSALRSLRDETHCFPYLAKRNTYL
jgi:hypothetical protein